MEWRVKDGGGNRLPRGVKNPRLCTNSRFMIRPDLSVLTCQHHLLHLLPSPLDGTIIFDLVPSEWFYIICEIDHDCPGLKHILKVHVNNLRRLPTYSHQDRRRLRSRPDL